MSESQETAVKNVEKEYFRFEKVDDYFKNTDSWHSIQKMETYEWEEQSMTLTLHLKAEDESKCVMKIQIATGSSFRVRFHPQKQEEDYAKGNTRTVVLESFQDLLEKNRTNELSAVVTELMAPDKAVELAFHGTLKDQLVKIHVHYEPFRMEVRKAIKGDAAREFTILNTPEEGLKFTYAGGFDDYKIVQRIEKPCTAKYVGFGEQGGMELVKNSARITYFNYDNMKYRQVYNHGPFEEREPLYHSDPFFMEVNGTPQEDSTYGIFIDNPSEVLLDMGYYNSTRYAFGTRYGDMDYYILTGDSCGDIIKSFSNIVGTARLIPRYALGYHQGCYGYENRQDVEKVVNDYRRFQIPLDGIHIDVDLQKNYKSFTIDENKFNNPAEMFAGLSEKGVKCSTNITPIISNRNTEGYATFNEGMEKGYFVEDVRFDPEGADSRTYYKYSSGEKNEYQFHDKENNYNSGKPFIGEVYYGNEGQMELGTTGHYPDLNRKEVRRWWGQQYQYLFDMGLEMVWQDMTTPCLRDSRGDMLSFPSRLMVKNDFIKMPEGGEYEEVPVMKVWNLYSYNLHKATYHGLNHLKGRENKRNFIIGRGCFTGMQRFAGLWTGDNSSSWDFLQINISQVLALGLTGQALSGQDIGGFERENEWEKWADPELLIRWTAMGAFLPWFRNHYIRKGRKLFQEPYEYQKHTMEAPEELRYLYESVLPVCKYYIEQRYILMQLFYDAMFENTLNGMPICRALFLTNPQDKALFNDKSKFLNTEFMVREDLLIAPVIEKQTYENGFGKRDVYLPAGNRWYQFSNQKNPLGAAIEGGTTVSEFNASINNEEWHIPYIVPIYVKEGAVIPTIDLEQYVGEKNRNGLPNPITLNIYPGIKGTYTMYLDDGESRSSQPEGEKAYGTDPAAKGEYRETKITHEYQSVSNRRIVIERVHDGYTPKYEKYMVAAILHGPEEEYNPIQSVHIQGEIVYSLEGGSEEILRSSEEAAWYYEAKNHTSYIKVPDNDTNIVIDIVYKGGSGEYFDGGDGSEENPYRIANAKQLNNLSMLTESNPELYASANYVLTKDIKTDSHFRPIGDYKHHFEGKFDGGIYEKNILTGVHKITLSLKTEAEYAGLFGVFGADTNTNARLCNLLLDGNVATTGEYAGGAAGWLYSGTIQNITLAKGMTIEAACSAGGVAGNSFAGRILNCTSYASVLVPEYSGSVQNAGGIVGYNAYIVQECCNAGTVKGIVAVGGIAGTSYPKQYSEASITDCLNIGEVTAKDREGCGIVSCNFGCVNNTCSIGSGYALKDSGRGNRNYYYAENPQDNYAEYKDIKEMENGTVTSLINVNSGHWVQGTVEGVVVEGLKTYPVLKEIAEKR